VLGDPGKGFRGLLSADLSSKKLLLLRSQLSKMEMLLSDFNLPLKIFLDPPWLMPGSY